MEKRISDYILHKLNPDNDFIKKGMIDVSYNILIHIAYEMIMQKESENQIKNRIDHLLTDPVKMIKP